MIRIVKQNNSCPACYGIRYKAESAIIRTIYSHKHGAGHDATTVVTDIGHVDFSRTTHGENVVQCVQYGLQLRQFLILFAGYDPPRHTFNLSAPVETLLPGPGDCLTTIGPDPNTIGSLPVEPISARARRSGKPVTSGTPLRSARPGAMTVSFPAAGEPGRGD
jgi:hypothetical protein